MSETVVVSDLHGQAEKFQDVVRHYGDSAHYVINGDVFDRGPDTKGVMDIIKDLDHDFILGNHEWVLAGALSDVDSVRRKAWQQMLLSNTKRQRYEMNVLSSYGLPEYSHHEDTAKALKEKLQQLGHWAILNAATMWFEDDNVFVVHAGLRGRLNMAHSHQRLDAFTALHQARNYLEEPDELASFELASGYEKPVDLSKILITGHVHFRKSVNERIYYCGHKSPQRVYLASYLDMGDPLFAYESNSGKIQTF